MTTSRSSETVVSSRRIWARFSPTVKLVRALGEPGPAAWSRRSGGPAPAPLIADGTTVAELDPRDLDGLAPRFVCDPRVVRDRADAGDLCFGIRDRSGMLASVAWVASDRSFTVAEVGADVWVPASTAYVYDVCTLPEWRGLGMMPALLRRMVDSLERAAPGKDRCEAWAKVRNRASVRAFRKAGFNLSGAFVFASLGAVHVSVGRPWLRDGWL